MFLPPVQTPLRCGVHIPKGVRKLQREFFRGGSEALRRMMFRLLLSGPSWADGVSARYSTMEVDRFFGVCVRRLVTSALATTPRVHVGDGLGARRTRRCWRSWRSCSSSSTHFGGWEEGACGEDVPNLLLCDSHGGCCCCCCVGREEGVAVRNHWHAGGGGSVLLQLLLLRRRRLLAGEGGRQIGVRVPETAVLWRRRVHIVSSRIPRCPA